MLEAFPTLEAVQAADPFELAAALASYGPFQLTEASAPDAERVVAATQRVINAMHARQLAAVAAVTVAVTDELDRHAADLRAAGSRGLRGIPGADQVAGSSLAPLTRVAPRTMVTTVHRAMTLVADLPRTFGHAWAGDLEPARVTAAVQASAPVARDRLLEFEARLYADDRVLSLPCGRFRARAAQAALKTDPDGVADRTAQAPTTRRVTTRPGDLLGMTHWEADLPSETSDRIWSAMDALAREYLTSDASTGATPARTVDQARADAFADLLLANIHTRYVVELVLPTTPATPSRGQVPPAYRPRRLRLADLPDDLTVASETATTLEWTLAQRVSDICTIDASPYLARGPDGSAFFVPARGVEQRTGLLLPSAIQAILADPDTTFRVRDGSPAPSPGYRPGAALARAVRARDVTCRFPGCSTPAAGCELDHVDPYPRGTTCLANLVCLCQTHHGFKHHAGWRLTLAPDGTCTWTAPTGRSHVTSPPDLHDAAA